MILGLLVLIVAVSREAAGQVINLKPPELNQHFHFGRVTLRPGDNYRAVENRANDNRVNINDNIQLPKPPARFLAKPGNVIVHFDRQHEIQQLQYVLQDGRLATLYQRHPQHPNNSRMPQQIPSSIELPEPVHRRDEIEQPATGKESATQSSGASNPEAKVSPEKPEAPAKNKQQSIRIDPDSTIEILDSKMNSISKLIGDHLTIAIPEEALEGSSSAINSTTGSEETDDERLDVLATIAVDAMAHVGEEKLKKAGILVDKIKSKVAAKLRDLPSLIEAKLRAKSSAGQAYLDQHGHVMRVVSEARPVSGEEKHIDNRRLVPAPTNHRVNYPAQMQLSPQRLVEA